jgi:hypothetical protein
MRIDATCVAHVSGKVNFDPRDQANEGIGKIAKCDGIEYPCASLDNIFRDSVAETCFTEMDIEGGEWLALQGARRVLSYPKSQVSLLMLLIADSGPSGTNHLQGGSVPGLKSVLQSMGFHVYALTPACVHTLAAGLNARLWWASSNAE